MAVPCTRSLCGLLSLIVVCACHKTTATETAKDGVDILFIGNSLTYTNDLPAMVAQRGRAAGANVRVQMVAVPNYALIDHVRGGSNAVATIRQGGWEFVVLQQGPTSEGPGPARDTLILATRLLDEEIRRIGARTALFEVWPARDRLAYFDNVRDAYRQAADAVGGIFIPAGEAWREAWRVNPDLALYGPDGFHPSVLGSELAAKAIAYALFLLTDSQ